MFSPEDGHGGVGADLLVRLVDEHLFVKEKVKVVAILALLGTNRSSYALCNTQYLLGREPHSTLEVTSDQPTVNHITHWLAFCGDLPCRLVLPV